MPDPTPSNPPASFEDALTDVESIIERIESGQIGLEESLGEYERGVALINHCRTVLLKAQQRVDDLTAKMRPNGGSGGGGGLGTAGAGGGEPKED